MAFTHRNFSIDHHIICVVNDAIHDTGDIKAVQLEIKDDTGVKVVDKTNDISSEKRHFRYGLKNVVRNGVALEKISEICFTVFFSKSYIDGESGTLSISNLKMVPDNSGKLIEMDS